MAGYTLRLGAPDGRVRPVARCVHWPDAPHGQVRPVARYAHGQTRPCAKIKV